LAGSQRKINKSIALVERRLGQGKGLTYFPSSRSPILVPLKQSEGLEILASEKTVIICWN
jgi:hypothetical protein